MGIYKKTMKQSGKTNFSRIPVKNSDLRPLEEGFKDALTKLKVELEVRKIQELLPIYELCLIKSCICV